LSYYHNEKEIEAIGTIYLKDIGNIQMNIKKHFEFIINATNYIKRGELKDNIELHFIAQTEDECDEWVITIEFLKSLAIHQSITTNFGTNINLSRKSFPSKSTFIKVEEKPLRSLPNLDIEIQKQIKDKIKTGFNYFFGHLVAHMIEHAYNNSAPISHTPTLINSLEPFNTLLPISEYNTNINHKELVHEVLIEEDKEVVNESIVQLEESDVMLSINQSGIKKKKEIVPMSFLENKRDSIIEGISPINPVEPKLLWKYNEGMEEIVGVNITNIKYKSQSNNLIGKNLNKKEKSILEIQRKKVNAQQSVSMDVVLNEMRSFLHEKLLNITPSEKQQILNLRETISTKKDTPTPKNEVRIPLNDKQIATESKSEIIKKVNNKKYGFVTSTVASLGGDIFQLKEDSVVIVEKVDYEDNIVTCAYKGMKGLFPLASIVIGNEMKEH